MLNFRVEEHDVLDSTNRVVKDALHAGAAEGLVVRAFAQTGGYGRQGRTWASPPGGLYQSLLLRPAVDARQLPSLGLVAALAVRRAALALAPSAGASGDVLVKWPNDVVCPQGAVQGKLAGISLEALGGGVCVGVGVNVCRPAGPPASGFAYLEDLAGGALELAATGRAVLAEFASCYEAWLLGGFAPFREEFAACDALAGSPVCVEDRTGGMLARGTACGVDGQGRLLVRAGDGRIQPVSSGEAHIGTL